MIKLPPHLTNPFYIERHDGLAVRLPFGKTFHLLRQKDEVAQVKRIVSTFYMIVAFHVVYSIALATVIMTLDVFAKDIVLAIIMIVISFGALLAFCRVLYIRLSKLILDKPIIAI